MQIPGEKGSEKLVGDSLALTSRVGSFRALLTVAAPGAGGQPRGVTPTQPF